MSFLEPKYQLKTSYFSEIFPEETSPAKFYSIISKKKIKISKTKNLKLLDQTLESASKILYCKAGNQFFSKTYFPD